MTMSTSAKRVWPRKNGGQSQYNSEKELRKSSHSSSSSSQSSTSNSTLGERLRHHTLVGSRSRRSRSPESNSRSRSSDYDRHTKRVRNDHRSSHDAEGEFSNEDARNDSQEDSINYHTGSEHCESHLDPPVRVPVTPIINQVDILREENENLKKAVENLKNI
jgi:hypothetical protein